MFLKNVKYKVKTIKAPKRMEFTFEKLNNLLKRKK